MNTSIQNRQSRISKIVKHFDFQTVAQVVEALNQQSQFDKQEGETLVDAIVRNSVSLIEQTCDVYEFMNTDKMFTNQVGNLQVTIQSRSNTDHKVSLSYVIDQMETYNS